MIGWLDASCGASGDMLLGALLDAGASETALLAAVEAVAPEPIAITTTQVNRGALAARRAHVEISESVTSRSLADIVTLLDAAELDDSVRHHARAVFTLLAEAEAAVHGTSTDAVHFHEVGALDAIADIVGVCAGFASLGLERLHCTPVAVGSGDVETAHGSLSVPPPAVTELLRGVPSFAGPAATELCTPTGAALLRHWVDSWGPQPAMVVQAIGVGAGQRDFPDHANVVRLLVGSATQPDRVATSVVLETNVDDLDPRLWPAVVERLLAAGASDAWLAPILMKKGRPAHTLSVLVRPEVSAAVRSVIYAETSAIGMREIGVRKHELAREFSTVVVEGHPIEVKVARVDGCVVNVQPEYDDVVAAAAALSRPIKVVLAAAIAQAGPLWRDESGAVPEPS
ncbi:MAG: nickel pincer cofactor biosynthesis protein LarC [Nocardioidaceae bacterium]